MGKGRVEAFSDGVIAIIITIMVLELKAPHGMNLAALRPLWPVFLSYVLSFVYVGIYWNNHHHLFHAVKRVSGPALWANLHFLFWLSLLPAVTSWLGESAFEGGPVASYGVVLLMCAVSWTLLARSLRRLHGPGSDLERALGRGGKERISLVMYVVGIGLALVGMLGRERLGRGERWVEVMGCVVYAVVAVMWFVPDRRIERTLASG